MNAIAEVLGIQIDKVIVDKTANTVIARSEINALCQLMGKNRVAFGFVQSIYNLTHDYDDYSKIIDRVNELGVVLMDQEEKIIFLPDYFVEKEN